MFVVISETFMLSFLTFSVLTQFCAKTWWLQSLWSLISQTVFDVSTKEDEETEEED